MREDIYFVACLLTWIAGCSSGSGPASVEDAHEAVFRHLVATHGQRICFLEINGDKQDPSSAFLARFAQERVTIKPRSAAIISDKDGNVSDRESGEKGIILFIRQTRPLGNDSVEVEAGFYSAAKAGAAWRYSVKRTAGKWIVTEEQLLERW